MASKVAPDDWDKFEAELYRPIPGQKTGRVSENVRENEMAAFREFSTQIG